MFTISNKQQLQTAMSELASEYANKLSAWWCRAQKPGKVFTIEYANIEDLVRQIDEHTEKASRRSQSRQSRLKGLQPERQQRSLAKQCLAVIKELAEVKAKSVKDVIKLLKEQIDEVRKVECVKAEAAAHNAAEKVNAFKLEHAELFAQLEALQAEQRKQEGRSLRLYGQILRRKQQTSRLSQSINEHPSHGAGVLNQNNYEKVLLTRNE